MTILTNLQKVLKQQLDEMDNMNPTDETSIKVIDKISRILDDLIETSNAFKESDSNYNESIKKLATNVDLLNGVLHNVRSGVLKNEKTVIALRIELRGLHKSVRQFRSVYIKDNTTGCPIKDARIKQ
jgi:SMC interacting uncharacterized protein involved in chromosome segregation